MWTDEWWWAPLLLASAGLATGCAADGESPVNTGTVDQAPFGEMPDGRTIEIFTLANPSGVEIRAMTYGAIIVSILVPDRDGRLADVVLGFDDLDNYLQGHPQFGTVVGRYANRIAGGQFVLDGETYTLARNNGPNHIHRWCPGIRQDGVGGGAGAERRWSWSDVLTHERRWS